MLFRSGRISFSARDESLVELDYSHEPIFDEERESSISSSCSQRIVLKTERREPFKQNKIGHKKKSTTQVSH